MKKTIFRVRLMHKEQFSVPLKQASSKKKMKQASSKKKMKKFEIT
jgi:hypothetical protein